MLNEKNIDNVLYFYEIRMAALSSYSDRVWSRFNWFVTLQVAIIGFYFSGGITDLLQGELLKITIPLVGLSIALLCILMGLEDYQSLRKHRIKCKDTENMILNFYSSKDVFFIESNEINNYKFRQSWLLFLFPIFTVFSWMVILFVL